MTEWVSENAWLSWVGFGVLLSVIELLSLDLVLAMFALGAFSAAVASALGAPFWLCLLIFGVISLTLLFFARPPMARRLHDGPTLTTGVHALAGREGVVLEPVDDLNGRIELAGEVWSARTEAPSRAGSAIESGVRVVVTRIEGATAVVQTKES